MSSPLQVPSLTEALCEALRERIVTGAIPGGMTLTEHGLAAEYGVARPTAKAAIDRLVNDGLLQRPQNRPARVPVMSVQDIEDLYFIRTMMEVGAISVLSARREIPQAALDSLDHLKKIATNPEIATVIELNVNFHRALIDAAGSPRLSRQYAFLMGEVHLCMAQVQAYNIRSPELIADDHAAILAAIGDGDEQKAVDIISVDLGHTRDRLVALLKARNSAPRAVAGITRTPTDLRADRG